MKTLAEQIECVKREIAYRRRLYPDLVGRGAMSVNKARHEINCMEAVLATLEALPKEQGDLL
jgi:hypothetical protein